MLCLVAGGQGAADTITAARYDNPTTRYAHAVLGDNIEHGALVLTLRSGEERRFELPLSSVFEDTAPRLVDVDLDGHPEVVTVESSQSQGARLAIYDATGRRAATPYIGTRFRWLAPIGAADLDGDGQVELAYIDRPHLAKTLRIWRFANSGLTQIASLPGLTNHRIGEADIAGGVRSCRGVAEMILATADWQKMVAVRMVGTGLETTVIGSDTSRAAFRRALSCAP
jgi:hypothetical protein